MTLPKILVTIKSEGVPRALLSFEENKKGDVYLYLRSGMQVGLPPENVLVKQHKYSLHPSPESPTYTTVTKTLKLANGASIRTCALTDAVKLKSGFSPIFSIRYSNLLTKCYDLPVKINNFIEQGNVNFNFNTLYLHLFVGHPSMIFPKLQGTALINQRISKHFSIVIAHCYTQTHASQFAWIMDRVTSPPETASNPNDKSRRWQQMQGKSIEECLLYFEKCNLHLYRNQLEILRDLADDGKDFFQALLDQTPPSPFKDTQSATIQSPS